MCVLPGRDLKGGKSRHAAVGRERCAYFFWQVSVKSYGEFLNQLFLKDSHDSNQLTGRGLQRGREGGLRPHDRRARQGGGASDTGTGDLQSDKFGHQRDVDSLS